MFVAYTDSNKTSPTSNGGDSPSQQSQQSIYRNLVIKDILDSEKAHVAELQTLVSNFLQPLQKSNMYVFFKSCNLKKIPIWLPFYSKGVC